ncbi:MAG: putative lipid II flippase FtsW [Gammaproteobacteria bacterium]|nr:putative lipid II flippase FtsW [Gammaproteobacteria bacterium]
MLKQQAQPRSPTAIASAPATLYDGWLVGTTVLLAAIGLVMVTSASIAIADRNFGEPLHYFWRQAAALGAGVIAIQVLLRVPLAWIEQLSLPAMLLGIVLLILLLVPGLGREVNGALRWLRLGPISVQVSEPMKVIAIAYLAGYLVRQGDKVRTGFGGFVVPVVLLLIVALLLLLEPDYGTAVVIFATALGMLFIGGVPWPRFVAWGLAAFVGLCTLAVLTPYRMQRLMTFTDPWADRFDTGFQLSQALIAFGRGEWFGVGLGGSVQKLFYLPEVHTDFIYAVIGEELGLAGSITIILAFTLLLWRIFQIAALAARKGHHYGAYLAYGVGMLIGFQAFTNIGVNLGVLPTKGLTLPLMSYGINSVLAISLGLGLVFRVAREIREAPGRRLRRGPSRA